MKQFKTTCYRLSVAMAGWSAALVAHGATTTDFSRFQVILDRKPFGEIAPIVAPGATDLAVAESFAKDYEMKAIIDDGDKLQVAILDKKSNKHVYLNVGQEIGGMQLVSVNYDNEEAVLKMGAETSVIKLHPDKDKNAGPVVAGVAGLPSFGMPGKNAAVEPAAAPFSFSDQSGANRRPFFSDMKRRGVSPFQRMNTNMAFPSRSLESFFKPNTNIATPFVSPFRPQALPLKPGAPGQENNGPAFPFAPIQTPDQGSGATVASQAVAQPGNPNQQIQASPNQGYQQIPIQPAPVSAVDNGTGESEE